MTATPCAIDGRPTPDGWVCTGCTARAASQLAAIAELVDDARAVAAGLVRRGGGGGSGKPGPQSPGDDGAMDVLGEVQNMITTLARDIAETRGVSYP